MGTCRISVCSCDCFNNKRNERRLKRMKIKGSEDFYNVEVIKENLEEVIKSGGKCTGLDCTECIFSSHYAIQGKCSQSTIFKINNGDLYIERLKKAREILAEIKQLEEKEVISSINIIENLNFNLGKAIECVLKKDLTRAKWYIEREIKRRQKYGK
jgi:hypothetical protein